jgi:hypothetical protein
MILPFLKDGKRENEFDIPVEFIWGKSKLSKCFSIVGSFQNDSPNWPQIYVTAPKEWVQVHLSLLNTFTILMTKKFLYCFEKGLVNEISGRFLLENGPFTIIEMKILGYFSEGTPPVFQSYRNLTEEEFEEFLKTKNRVELFYKDLKSFQPIIENYEDIYTVIDGVMKDFMKNKRPDFSGLSTMRITNSLNNWLSSITSYLNHMEDSLKSRDDCMCWEKYKTLKAEQYDKNPSYRFIYGLRNFSQHRSSPFRYKSKSRLVDEEEIFGMDIFCEREELLADLHWNKKTRKDLENLEEKIDVLNHVSSMMDSLAKLLTSHCENEFVYLEEDAIYLRKLIDEIPKGSDRGVYEVMHKSDGKWNINAYLLHENIITAILEKDTKNIIEIEPVK